MTFIKNRQGNWINANYIGEVFVRNESPFKSVPGDSYVVSVRYLDNLKSIYDISKSFEKEEQAKAKAIEIVKNMCDNTIIMIDEFYDEK